MPKIFKEGIELFNRKLCGPGKNQKTLALQKSRMLQIQGIDGEAVVTYREPSTSLRQGFGPAGNEGDAVSSTFPTCLAVASAKAGGQNT